MKKIYDHKHGAPPTKLKITTYSNTKKEPLLINRNESMTGPSASPQTTNMDNSLFLSNDFTTDADTNTLDDNVPKKSLEVISSEKRFSDAKTGSKLTDIELFKTLWIPMIGLSFLGIISGYAYYWCLKYVDAAIANTVYQSECAYVYILSICFVKNMKVNAQKIIAIIVSLTGVALITLFGTGDSSNDGTIKNETKTEQILGIGLLLFSTITFSILETLVNYVGNKWFRKDRQIQDTLLLQSIMGLETLLIWWVLFFIWQWTGLESFELPSTKKQVVSIVFTSIMDLLYNGAYFVGITLLNAFLMAMSSLLVIPISFIALAIIYSDDPTVLGILGAIMIFIGFILLELPFKKIFPCCDRKDGKKWYILNTEE